MYSAVASGDIATVEEILKQKSNGSIPRVEEGAALAKAIQTKNLEMITLLIKHEHINVNNVKDGLTALLLAVRYDNKEMVQCILKHCPSYKQLAIMAKGITQNKEESTALHWAIKSGFSDLSKDMLSALTASDDFIC